MNPSTKTLFEKAETLGWAVTEEDPHEYRFSKSSPAGQDFSIVVEGESAEELIENIREVHDNYDVSEEAYLWLDNTGHGKNGAPYEMKDVLADMEACKEMVLCLHDKLSACST